MLEADDESLEDATFGSSMGAVDAKLIICHVYVVFPFTNTTNNAFPGLYGFSVCCMYFGLLCCLYRVLAQIYS